VYTNKHENALAIFRRRYPNALLINNVLDNKFRRSCSQAAFSIGMPARFNRRVFCV